METQDNLFQFQHDKLTKELCPEAQGHFCMLRGEHGRGGYDSEIRGYIQGGQSMDKWFELIAIYSSFEEVKVANDFCRMRLIITELRRQREKMGISHSEEKKFRGEKEENSEEENREEEKQGEDLDGLDDLLALLKKEDEPAPKRE